MNRTLVVTLLASALAAALTSAAHAQATGVGRPVPNTEANVDRPMRYRPDGPDFVIENGAEYFNRPLYGGNTAFRVDAGDKPEFALYLPGRGGNLRLGIRAGNTAKWLSDAQRVDARYRPGGMIYDVHDPLLGPDGALHLEAYALAATEGLVLKIETRTTTDRVELLWAFGGVNGRRGARDGDIGTERVPIGEYFQLAPDACRGNAYAVADGSFRLAAAAATLFARVPGPAQVADARQWATPAGLFASVRPTPASLPVAVGHANVVASVPLYMSVQKLARDLPGTTPLPPLAAADLPAAFAAADGHFRTLRERVRTQTPDPLIDAAVGALGVAADALWDEPQGAIMHGAIAWRTRLLGWRGPYALDDLGWHDRAARNIAYWATRQNTRPVPAALPPADASQNLARNEAGLHSNGDLSNSHYDMNLVHVDAVFRHLLWTGDLDLGRREWPVIERHLAWERRLFRRPYGPRHLPLYEAYAAIWASDDLSYGGGGTAHASAYNYYANVMAARLARLIGADPAPYDAEAGLIRQAMQQYLWMPDQGGFAECRDFLGLQLPHPDAALWTVYHTIDSGVPTPIQAWQMTRHVDAMPHIPVRGPGVPADPVGFALVPTTTWMPYLWSVNNVCMNEDAHMALAYFEAGRAGAGARLLKGAILASMYMGISPGNVGTMTYLDVYRRESQRDFGDGAGTLSRAVVEGLFGVRPDALAGELRLAPGFPPGWDHATLTHPDLAYSWRRSGQTDTFTIEPRFARPMALRLVWPACGDGVPTVTVNGAAAAWQQDDQAVGGPRLTLTAPACAKWDVAIRWTGSPIAPPPPAVHADAGRPMTFTPPAAAGAPSPRSTLLDPQHLLSAPTPHAADAGFDARAADTAGVGTVFLPVRQGAWAWQMAVDVTVTSAVATPPALNWTRPAAPAARYDTVDLTRFFNARVTDLFKQEYRTPRSPFVSLAIPKQGLGAWAGDVRAAAVIDDAGLRARAAAGSGRVVLPNGVPFATPPAAGAANVVFTSQWDNFPKQVTVPLTGSARRVLLLMAGSTNPMQSRFDNGEVTVTYADGTAARLALNNPMNWWPIEQDYLIDDYQFRRPGPTPPRIDLATGEIRLPATPANQGRGGRVAGGAATVLDLPLDPAKRLQSLTVHALANDVVIGLMSATLSR